MAGSGLWRRVRMREALAPRREQGARWTGGRMAAPGARGGRAGGWAGGAPEQVPWPEQLCAHSLTLHDGPPQPGGQRQRPSPGRQSPRKLQSPGQARSSQPSPLAYGGQWQVALVHLPMPAHSPRSDLAHALLSQSSPPKPRWHWQTPCTHSPRPWQSSAHAGTPQCSPLHPSSQSQWPSATDHTPLPHSCCSMLHASPRQPGWQ